VARAEHERLLAQSEATAECYLKPRRDGCWFCTGDAGYLRDGYLRYPRPCEDMAAG
jgi:hypothetical protein